MQIKCNTMEPVNLNNRLTSPSPDRSLWHLNKGLLERCVFAFLKHALFFTVDGQKGVKMRISKTKFLIKNREIQAKNLDLLDNEGRPST